MATNKTKEATLPTHETFDANRDKFAKGKYNSVMDEQKRYIRTSFKFAIKADVKIIFDKLLSTALEQLGIKAKKKDLYTDKIMATSKKNGNIPIRVTAYSENNEFSFEYFTQDQWTIRSFTLRTKNDNVKIKFYEELKNITTVFGMKSAVSKRYYMKNRMILLKFQSLQLKYDLGLMSPKQMASWPETVKLFEKRVSNALKMTNLH